MKRLISLLLLSASSMAWDSYAQDSVVKKFEEVTHAIKGLEAKYSCEERTSPECPNVHVSPWCQKQYEFLKNSAPEKNTVTKKDPSSKQILFLGEEHGDEQAYSYYEKLLKDKNAGYDCLFLELPTVFQKNFDDKKGIIHEGGVFTNLNKEIGSNEIRKIELTDFSYRELLESLVETAKKNNVKVLLVDGPNKFKGDPLDKSEIMRRNTEMAQNIQSKFSQNECSQGLSIQGNMHLFTKDQGKLIPIDEIIKNDPKNKIEIKKAFIYSSGSERLKEAMGPCSWINILPREKEIYYSGKSFTSQNNLFPEKIHSSLKEKYQGIAQDVDQVVFLPLQLDKDFVMKKINKSMGLSAPKKFKTKSEVSMKSEGVPLSLRSNYSSLNMFDNEKGLSKKCDKICGGMRSKIVISDIVMDEPEISCKSYHPSWTNGATSAPEIQINQTIKADCYCTKK